MTLTVIFDKTHRNIDKTTTCFLNECCVTQKNQKVTKLLKVGQTKTITLYTHTTITL